MNPPDLNPGIRRVVELLNKAGHETCDSGDGKTHDHTCDREGAYVVVVSTPEDLANDTRLLVLLLERYGVRVVPQADQGVHIQANYDPALSGRGAALIDIRNLTDGMLRDPEVVDAEMAKEIYGPPSKPDDIEATIRAACESATVGPWRWDLGEQPDTNPDPTLRGPNNEYIVGASAYEQVWIDTQASADFIASARAWVPLLLERLQLERERAERLQEELVELAERNEPDVEGRARDEAELFGDGPFVLQAEREYQIWAEGWAATGGGSPAQLLGTSTGHSFEDACERFAAGQSEAFRRDFMTNPPRYWGCRLFDNERDARRAFG